MAVIPQATSRRTLDTGRGSTPSFRISNAPGRALQSLGASISAFAERAQQQQNEMAAFKAQSGFIDLQGQTDQLLRDAQANLTPGAEGFHDDVLGRFDTLSNNFLGTIQNPEVRQRAELRVRQLRNSFSNNAANVELGERSRFFGAELDRLSNGFLTAIENNPANIQSSIDQFTVTVQDSGLSPVQKQARIQAFKETAIERALIAIGSNNPTLAKRVMNQIRRLQATTFGGAQNPSNDINQSLPETLVRPGAARFVPGRGRLARGIRNNNPGNIEFGRFARSKGATASDGRFARFNTPEEGIAAMAALLRGYQQNRGLDTIRKMIRRYAPPSENNTKAYINAVARAVGIGPDQRIDLAARPDLAARMVAAMILHENGRQPYSAPQITEGVSAGLGRSVDGTALSRRVSAQKVKGTQVRVATPKVMPDIDTSGVPMQVDPDVIEFTRVAGPGTITQDNVPNRARQEGIGLAENRVALEDISQEAMEAILGQVARLPNIDEIPEPEISRRSIEEPSQLLDEALEAAVQIPETELPDEAKPIVLAASQGQVVLDLAAFERIKRSVTAAERAADAAQDDFERDQGDAVFKELLTRSVRRQLSIEQIEANKDILSASQFSQLLKAATSEGASKSDPTTFADLLARADEDPEGVQRDALRAFGQGLLRQTDLTQLFSITRSVEGRRPRWFQSVKDFVRFSLKPNPIFDLDGALARKQQRAILDFEQFFLDNPEVTFEDARKRAQEIVDQAVGQGTSTNIPGLDKPAFIQGEPTIEKLNEAARKVQQMFDAGEMTQEDRDKQGRLILQWMQRLGVNIGG